MGAFPKQQGPGRRVDRDGRRRFRALASRRRQLIYGLSNSQVVFRKNPGSLKDLLDLFLGRIKVHIQKLGGGPNQQRVFTPTAVISVRGTIFDVSVDEDETTVVAVDEGLVSVSHRLLPSNIGVDVPAGQSLIIYRNAPLAKAGVDKSKAVAFADEVARTLRLHLEPHRPPLQQLTHWRRRGGRSAGRRTRRRAASARGHPGSRASAPARQLATSRTVGVQAPQQSGMELQCQWKQPHQRPHDRKSGSTGSFGRAALRGKPIGGLNSGPVRL